MTVAAPNRFAVDSNVIVYLFSNDAAKADKAEELVAGEKSKPVISTQVMNEVTLVMSRKMGLPWPEIESILEDVEVLCEVVPLTLEVHKEARRVAAHYGFRFYDSCIIAFALLNDCEVLYSEDMHHGQVIFDRLTVINPFL
ncbi:twitching motility protein PilT (plasmid) [Burkholderia sp. SFA1]|uniref:PIN domain-containing protein n=1 Tax=unclassified Caballeronia TaxID=2646786 RepID=UPI0002388665|nr:MULTISPECIES: PIN domain-containing protein [unclassified Caballeronia]AET94970.1 PilT domain-containing protein [Burkholderia sp. YI23]MCE4547351.1 PIN domain-containing protein [Caballeronia sp. PC1]MCE4575335.1 PIN domain-containing protein [Caballeronia sp. CLC5]BBQ03360.1 twitching motility protein PilT [Burkholderia sp. SFA1]